MPDLHLRGILLWAVCSFLALYSLTAAGARQTVFPLHISANQRYLEDAAGQPFLMVADTAWSLIGDLSREEIDSYLADRKKRGFNTILVSLIEHHFSRNAPRNFYQQSPFKENGNFAAPNEAYFDNVEWFLRRASDDRFLVLLVPAYLGVNGGNEGWYREMQIAGAGALKTYGDYIGKRFAKFSNIIWIQGGDYDPPDRDLVESLATAIAIANPGTIQSVHGGRDARTDFVWPEAHWKQLDTVYTYGNVAAATLQQYLARPTRPFFLIEGVYEGENGATEETVRTSAYSALLTGAAGQVFGNNPVWHFSGPGLHGETVPWPMALSSRGAQSMTYLKDFFNTIPWWNLEPDQGKTLTSENTSTSGIAVAGRSRDGKLIAVYLSGMRSLTLRADVSKQSTTNAKWFDPSSGKYIPAKKPMVTTAGNLEYTVPNIRNASGYGDWLLVLTQGD
ncbi:DUF4038 domain-containing protein [Phyllobacterium sp. OV277]|uniref:apiosidase-like domain-containing protein n=1 Tax=Phyllobacterium sp. OV277 TaxID=1882772 RepID=UPI0008857928|nr:DUF4038 domain-containing protein [Phyllobacterium sp. OV277]SDP38004.1 Putative collagen-binding domain of a collagenase [Phyllobacterium sp. OV277]